MERLPRLVMLSTNSYWQNGEENTINLPIKRIKLHSAINYHS